jgi:hypothetical protein
MRMEEEGQLSAGKLKYQSKLQLPEEVVIRKGTVHFEEVFQIVEQFERSNQSFESEISFRGRMADKAKDFCSIFVDLGLPKNIERQFEDQLMVFYLVAQFFRVNFLAETPNKSKHLLEILNKFIPQVHETPLSKTSPTELGRKVCLLLVKGEFKPVIDFLNAEYAKIPLIRVLVRLLNDRLNIIFQIGNQSKLNPNTENQFHLQKDEANELIARMDEIADEHKRGVILAILNLLAGNEEHLSEVADDNKILLLKGYLLFVDPFLSDSKSHQKMMAIRGWDIEKEVLFEMLNESHGAVEILLLIRQGLPGYVYIPLLLHALYQGKINKGIHLFNEIPIDEHLVDYAIFLAENCVDLISCKEIIVKAFEFVSPENEEMYNCLKRTVLNICLQTLDKDRNTSNKAVMKDLRSIIFTFLRNQGLEDLLTELDLELLNTEKANPIKDMDLDVIADILRSSPSQRSFPRMELWLDGLVSDTHLKGLTSGDPQDKEAAALYSEEVFKALKDTLGKVFTERNQVSNSSITFIDEYLKLYSVVTPSKNSQLSDSVKIGNAFAQLAREFAHQPSYYRLIYGLLLFRRDRFLGLSGAVEQLIESNLRMIDLCHLQLDIVRLTDDKARCEYYTTILQVAQKANFLLVMMKVNCIA